MTETAEQRIQRQTFTDLEEAVRRARAEAEALRAAAQRMDREAQHAEDRIAGYRRLLGYDEDIA